MGGAASRARGWSRGGVGPRLSSYAVPPRAALSQVFSMRAHSVLALAALLAPVCSCAAPGGARVDPDPRREVVPLPTEAEGWDASLVVDNEPAGVWTVGAFPFFAQYGSPEVIGLDDRGRCLVCVLYSGKWTPTPIIEDGKWLGGLAHGDVDPRIEGAELYTGGQNGNLYQVVPYPNGVMDYRRIAYLPGREIHTLVAGDLDPRGAGAEVLVFTRPGGLYRVSPTWEHGTFVTEPLGELPGRVRDARVLPALDGGPAEIAVVSRAGWLKTLTLAEDGPRWSTVHETTMGMGRVEIAPAVPGRGTVLYTSHDDGRILRHERGADGGWTTEAIYLGPQGPRGIASGRFHEDPALESVVVFGYSKKVQMLTRRGDAWELETIFVDRDKGHWITAAELDGRNATHEILASGYGARIVLLSRPPGFGRTETVDER